MVLLKQEVHVPSPYEGLSAPSQDILAMILNRYPPDLESANRAYRLIVDAISEKRLSKACVDFFEYVYDKKAVPNGNTPCEEDLNTLLEILEEYLKPINPSDSERKNPAEIVSRQWQILNGINGALQMRPPSSDFDETDEDGEALFDDLPDPWEVVLMDPDECRRLVRDSILKSGKAKQKRSAEGGLPEWFFTNRNRRPSKKK